MKYFLNINKAQGCLVPNKRIVMNLKLKAKIIEKYGKQWMFAKDIGVDESYVSRIITGARLLPDTNKKEWADLLGSTVEQLFQEGE